MKPPGLNLIVVAGWRSMLAADVERMQIAFSL
jgi:hypothetical protein